MEAQLQRRHIRAATTFPLAATLAATLLLGSVAGYAIGVAVSGRDAQVAPAPVELSTSRATHDDWAYSVPAPVENLDSTSRSIRDDWAFESAAAQSAAERQGVQSRHEELREATGDGATVETPDVAPLGFMKPY